jgi:hypothetical protein
VISKGVEFIPVAGPLISSGIDLADPTFKSAVMGSIPDSTLQANSDFADSSLLANQYYQIALGMQAANGGVLEPYEGLDDFRDGPNGPLLPYHEIVSDRPSFATPMLSSNLVGYITEAGLPGVGEFVDAVNAGREQVQNLEVGR